MKAGKHSRAGLSNTVRLLLRLITLALMLWLFFGVAFGAMRAPNNDMRPRVDMGDLLLFFRLDRDFRAKEGGALEKDGKRFVGRVAACPGDTVEVTDSETFLLNGYVLVEPEIYEATPRYEGFQEYPVTLGEGEYFILVDARDGGEDSRYYGVVSEKEILGKVVTLVRRNGL
mgnify:CR=1 FL=1